MRWVLSLAVACLSLTSGVALGQYRAWHGAAPDRHEAWIRDVSNLSFRLDTLTAFNFKGEPRFNGVAIGNREGAEWRTRHALDAAAFQKLFDECVAAGFRLTQIAGYLEGGQLRYAGVWVKGDGEQRRWEARFGRDSDAFQKAFDEQAAAGMRPTQIVGYATGSGGVQLAAIFLADKTPWLARHGQTAVQFQQTIDESTSQGYRPASLSVYPTADGPRFAVVLVKDQVAWKAQHGMSSDRYQQLFDEYGKQAFRPLTVAGYETIDGLRFAAVWVK